MQNPSNENLSFKAIKHDKTNYWREVIAAWEKSGEPQKNFCARMNIRMGTFSHWRGVFSKENKKIENKFIEVQVTRPGVTLDEFIIECPSGHKIVFTSPLSTERAELFFKLLGLTT